MFDKIKEITFFGFTISLVVAYSSCMGYFLHFNLDITSYITIEDLILIFAKYTCIGAVFIAISSMLFIHYFRKEKKDHSFWDKTIGRSIYKRRIVLFLVIFIICVVMYFINNTVSLLLKLVMVSIAIILFFNLIIYLIYYGFSGINKSDYSMKDLASSIIAIFILVFATPFIIGFNLGISLKPDQINIQYDDDFFSNTASPNLMYIGKTSKYFFIYDSITKTTTSYSLESVKSIEVIPNAEILK